MLLGFFGRCAAPTCGTGSTCRPTRYRTSRPRSEALKVGAEVRLERAADGATRTGLPDAIVRELGAPPPASRCSPSP